MGGRESLIYCVGLVPSKELYHTNYGVLMWLLEGFDLPSK